MLPCLGAGLAGECSGEGTTLRWENFGSPFFAENCNACHPYGRYERVYELRQDILNLVSSGNMPLFEVLPAEAKERLAEWIACGLPLEGPACPPGGTGLSYTGFAAPVFASRCGSCHAQARSGEDRGGAPPGMDWDVYAAVLEHLPAIRDQVARGTMPFERGPLEPLEIDGLLEWIACGAPERPPAVPYRRGDANDDGAADIADAVYILLHLFAGAPSPGCADALDADGSGRLDLSDSIRLLRHLFLDDPPPPPPYESCGSEPWLGCAAYTGCLPE